MEFFRVANRYALVGTAPQHDAVSSLPMVPRSYSHAQWCGLGYVRLFSYPQICQSRNSVNAFSILHQAVDRCKIWRSCLGYRRKCCKAWLRLARSNDTSELNRVDAANEEMLEGNQGLIFLCNRPKIYSHGSQPKQ